MGTIKIVVGFVNDKPKGLFTKKELDWSPLSDQYWNGVEIVTFSLEDYKSNKINVNNFRDYQIN